MVPTWRLVPVWGSSGVRHRFRWPRIVVTLLALALFALPLAAVDPESSPSTVDFEKVASAVVAAVEFRDLARSDYWSALARFATPEVGVRFAELETAVWSHTDPTVGWSYFMSTSVWTVAASHTDSTRIAFYQPWADLFLLTEWMSQDGEARLVDIELVLGGLVRQPDARRLDPNPGWWTSELFGPLALGTSVSSSLRAFQAHFEPGADWEETLPLLAAEGFREQVNYPLAAHRLLGLLIAADEYRHPDPNEDPRLTALRTASVATLEESTRLGLAAVAAAAGENPPATLALLSQLPPDTVGQLLPVAHLGDHERSTLFLVPTNGAGYCLSFTFDLGSASTTASRIDLIPWQALDQALHPSDAREATDHGR